MAKIPPPKSKKGQPPKPQQAVANNLEKTDPADLKPLNFKVPAEFHREFKTYAASHGTSMLELLREGFELIKQQNSSVK